LITFEKVYEDHVMVLTLPKVANVKFARGSNLVNLCNLEALLLVFE